MTGEGEVIWRRIAVIEAAEPSENHLNIKAVFSNVLSG